MRTIFLTDIHNHYHKAMALLRSINYTKDDKLVLGGDYFDRGPDADLVASWLSDIYDNDNVVLLRGNHDLALIKLLNRDYKKSVNDYIEIEFMINANGLDKTIASLTGFKYINKSFDTIVNAINKRFPKLKDALNSTVWYHETNTSIFTHSTLSPTYKTDDDIAWIDNVWNDTLAWAKAGNDINKNIYVGHYALVNIPHWDGLSPMKINNVFLCDGALGWGHPGIVVIAN